MKIEYSNASNLTDEDLYGKYVQLRKSIDMEKGTTHSDYIKEMKDLLMAVLLKYKAIKFGDFVLKSKRKSKYFFSSGVLNNIVSANIISFLIANLILTKNIPFDYLLGASYKGIPIVTLTSHFLFSSNKFANVFYLYDRKEKKEYGDKTAIVGNIDEQDTTIIDNGNTNHSKEKNVIIIDDVFTCGTALGEIINKLKCYHNLKVIAFIVLLNRNEYEINEMNEKVYFKDLFEQKFHIPLYSILSYNEDLEHIIG
ncbi:orotate phosphoribosyltransferase [Plasmodium brasilianum]|uniref:orotate phosphoribosyltransferase n=2 Tax=Plasmodium (Plasmodium) TaxID=418103 RepID=A0A1A8W0I7_PLAMA|nr:orotate phosphoribosyltransferase, putative [Plasmodium malariae]KAI4837847.1 orotate phosphoribosyltransferase [Plasmodium brasilianum]SBS86395.1 orotate phosphoribosyltransferase [Plasmodium malariae]SBT71751.1 orotate phosphoribosyltransferase, putative [Plasmodium malariae]SCN44938.1 orotate phosphoribosyltransferase, putative [Plasmodium malariae]